MAHTWMSRPSSLSPYVSQMGRKCVPVLFSSMMHTADCSSEMQQKAVLTNENKSIQIISPQTGSMSMITMLDSALTTTTEMPYPRESAELVGVQKTTKDSMVSSMPGTMQTTR